MNNTIKYAGIFAFTLVLILVAFNGCAPAAAPEAAVKARKCNDIYPISVRVAAANGYVYDYCCQQIPAPMFAQTCTGEGREQEIVVFGDSVVEIKKD